MARKFGAKLGMLKVVMALALMSAWVGCGATIEDDSVMANSSQIEKELGGPIESRNTSKLGPSPEVENRNCTSCGASALCGYDRTLRRCCTLRNGHYYDCGCTPERC